MPRDVFITMTGNGTTRWYLVGHAEYFTVMNETAHLTFSQQTIMQPEMTAVLKRQRRVYSLKHPADFSVLSRPSVVPVVNNLQKNKAKLRLMLTSPIWQC